MNTIEGVALPFEMDKLKWLVDLIYIEGPLLSLFQHESGDYYLLYWIDCDDCANRWMIVRVGLNDILRYIHREISLRSLLTSTADRFVRIVDLDDKSMPLRSPALISCTSLPEEFLPEEDSFFSSDGVAAIEESVKTTVINVSIPERDMSFLSSLVERMGWKISVDNIKELAKKTAVL